METPEELLRGRIAGVDLGYGALLLLLHTPDTDVYDRWAIGPDDRAEIRIADPGWRREIFGLDGFEGQLAE